LKKLIIFIFMLLFLSGCNNDSNNNVNQSNYTKLSSNTTQNTEVPNTVDEVIEPPVQEIELNTYVSNVLDKSSGRVTNLQLACNILNSYIVPAGETFSFNSVVGATNKEKGYQKAKIFDSKGNVLEEYGGGICQISSTLFNAIEPCNVEIIERHQHSKRVYYVPENRDAAISYSSKDFKFKNNNDFDLKIYAEATSDNVTIKIYKLF